MALALTQALLCADHFPDAYAGQNVSVPHSNPPIDLLIQTPTPTHNPNSQPDQNPRHAQQPHPQGMLALHASPSKAPPMHPCSHSCVCAVRSRPRTGRRAWACPSSRSPALSSSGTSAPRPVAVYTPPPLGSTTHACPQTLVVHRVRFDVRLMQRVPYEGVSRMQTSLRRRHRDRVVRRGLALIIESDFYATDAGRQHFASVPPLKPPSIT